MTKKRNNGKKNLTKSKRVGDKDDTAKDHSYRHLTLNSDSLVLLNYFI